VQFLSLLKCNKPDFELSSENSALFSDLSQFSVGTSSCG